MKKKILFMHQGPHPVHGAFANSITKKWRRCGDNPKEILKNLLKLFFERNKYDVIFSESGQGLPCAFVKKIFNAETQIILLNADNFFYLMPRSSIFKSKIMKFLLSKVDYIIAISEMNKKTASTYFKGEIAVVNSFGVNNHFEINNSYESKKLLFIGNNRPDKRYDLLIEAVSLLNENNGDPYELYLVGSCCDDVKSNYKWLHKEGFKKDLSTYFKKCSIYVHPTDFDPCPVSIFEAMSSGLIPIITENTGQSDIFKEKGLEYLILNNNNPKNIALKIAEIYEKPTSSKKIISDKCKDISKEFSEDEQVEKFKRIFDEILKR